MRKNCLRSGRSWSLYLFIWKVIKQTVVIMEVYHFCGGISRTKQNTQCTLRHHGLLLTDTETSLPVKDILSSSDPPQLLSTTYSPKFIQHPALKINSICRGIYLGSSVWIPTQQVSYWSYTLNSSDTWDNMGKRRSMRHLFIAFNKAYDSVTREELYNILFEYGIAMKLVRLI
jgi:hypothetical protein